MRGGKDDSDESVQVGDYVSFKDNRSGGHINSETVRSISEGIAYIVPEGGNKATGIEIEKVKFTGRPGKK